MQNLVTRNFSGKGRKDVFLNLPFESLNTTTQPQITHFLLYLRG